MDQSTELAKLKAENEQLLALLLDQEEQLTNLKSGQNNEQNNEQKNDQNTPSLEQYSELYHNYTELLTHYESMSVERESMIKKMNQIEWEKNDKNNEKNNEKNDFFQEQIRAKNLHILSLQSKIAKLEHLAHLNDQNWLSFIDNDSLPIHLPLEIDKNYEKNPKKKTFFPDLTNPSNLLPNGSPDYNKLYNDLVEKTEAIHISYSNLLNKHEDLLAEVEIKTNILTDLDFLQDFFNQNTHKSSQFLDNTSRNGEIMLKSDVSIAGGDIMGAFRDSGGINALIEHIQKKAIEYLNKKTAELQSIQLYNKNEYKKQQEYLEKIYLDKIGSLEGFYEEKIENFQKSYKNDLFLQKNALNLKENQIIQRERYIDDEMNKIRLQYGLVMKQECEKIKMVMEYEKNKFVENFKHNFEQNKVTEKLEKEEDNNGGSQADGKYADDYYNLERKHQIEAEMFENGDLSMMGDVSEGDRDKMKQMAKRKLDEQNAEEELKKGRNVNKIDEKNDEKNGGGINTPLASPNKVNTHSNDPGDPLALKVLSWFGWGSSPVNNIEKNEQNVRENNAQISSGAVNSLLSPTSLDSVPEDNTAIVPSSSHNDKLTNFEKNDQNEQISPQSSPQNKTSPSNTRNTSQTSLPTILESIPEVVDVNNSQKDEKNNQNPQNPQNNQHHFKKSPQSQSSLNSANPLSPSSSSSSSSPSLHPNLRSSTNPYTLPNIIEVRNRPRPTWDPANNGKVNNRHLRFQIGDAVWHFDCFFDQNMVNKNKKELTFWDVLSLGMLDTVEELEYLFYGQTIVSDIQARELGMVTEWRRKNVGGKNGQNIDQFPPDLDPLYQPERIMAQQYTVFLDYDNQLNNAILTQLNESQYYEKSKNEKSKNEKNKNEKNDENDENILFSNLNLDTFGIDNIGMNGINPIQSHNSQELHNVVSFLIDNVEFQ